jgi:aldose 1-epimerase
MKLNFTSLFLLILLIVVLSNNTSSFATGKKETKGKMGITKEFFGKTDAGESVDLYTLTNNKGMIVKIITYGGILNQIWAPDKYGKFKDVILGFDKLEGYVHGKAFIGALVGRYANRIGKAKFTLDGKEYKLAANNNGNALHGGTIGFNSVVWKGTPLTHSKSVALKLEYLSKDGEEGYPGNMNVVVIYSLNDNNEIEIDYSATCDKKTVVNLTNHAYFNLTGSPESDILNQVMMINADKYTPINETLIPTGKLEPIKGTPLDFKNPEPIGTRIDDKFEQIVLAGGYDHNWVLNKEGNALSLAARVFDPLSGRVLEVLTTEPGIQFYSGNFLNGSETGIGNIQYDKRHGFCLETQHFPDSPNKPEFPSVVLEPGKKYSTKTIFKFSINK